MFNPSKNDHCRSTHSGLEVKALPFFEFLDFLRLLFVVEVNGIFKTNKKPKTELAATHTATATNWRRLPFVVHTGMKTSSDILVMERQVWYIELTLIEYLVQAAFL